MDSNRTVHVIKSALLVQVQYPLNLVIYFLKGEHKFNLAGVSFLEKCSIIGY